MIRATIDLPKQWGPLQRAAAQPQADAASARRDHDARGLPQGRHADARARSVRSTSRSILIYQEASAFIDTHDYLKEHLPNVQSILLPSTQWGHFGPLEQPREVADAIVRRLLERSRRRRGCRRPADRMETDARRSPWSSGLARRRGPDHRLLDRARTRDGAPPRVRRLPGVRIGAFRGVARRRAAGGRAARGHARDPAARSRPIRRASRPAVAAGRGAGGRAVRADQQRRDRAAWLPRGLLRG